MGIKVEFNPVLALRASGTVDRAEEECIPKSLEAGKTYKFLKQGQRLYWLEGEIPLAETKGNQQLSRPLASITILEAVHVLINNQVHTKGTYKVNEVFNINDKTIHFESMNKI